MNLLLDSHYLIWALQAPHLLGDDERSVIEDTGNQIHFSSISIMELNIKASKGKLALASNVARFCIKTGFQPLSYTWQHAEETRQLPLIHFDPFDRMLAAQAKYENLVFMTRDKHLRDYPIAIYNVSQDRK